MSAIDKLSEYRRTKAEQAFRKTLGRKIPGKNKITAEQKMVWKEQARRKALKSFKAEQAGFPKRKLRVSKTKKGQMLITNL